MNVPKPFMLPNMPSNQIMPPINVYTQGLYDAAATYQFSSISANLSNAAYAGYEGPKVSQSNARNQEELQHLDDLKLDDILVSLLPSDDRFGFDSTVSDSKPNRTRFGMEALRNNDRGVQILLESLDFFDAETMNEVDGVAALIDKLRALEKKDSGYSPKPIEWMEINQQLAARTKERDQYIVMVNEMKAQIARNSDTIRFHTENARKLMLKWTAERQKNVESTALIKKQKRDLDDFANRNVKLRSMIADCMEQIDRMRSGGNTREQSFSKSRGRSLSVSLPDESLTNATEEVKALYANYMNVTGIPPRSKALFSQRKTMRSQEFHDYDPSDSKTHRYQSPFKMVRKYPVRNRYE